MTGLSAEPRRPSAGMKALGVVLAAAGGLVWLIPLVILIYIIPKSVEVFDKFDMPLPALTRVIIAVTGVVAHVWYLAALVWLAVVAGLVGASLAARSNRAIWASGIFAAASVGLTMLVVGGMVVGLFVPLVTLVEATGGG